MHSAKILAPLLAIAAMACSAALRQPTTPPSWAAMPEQPSPAFTQAARLQAATIAALPAPTEAGIWLVQDTKGQLLSSGVLPTFPASISSADYTTVVPGAAGLHAEEFGFARTVRAHGQGPYRVAYVIVAARS
jgi:hypothetical protein